MPINKAVLGNAARVTMILDDLYEDGVIDGYRIIGCHVDFSLCRDGEPVEFKLDE